MPCTGLAISSPNISCLDFELVWDLSGATPTVTIVNNSTYNTTAPNQLNWWFYVASPSGVPIYGSILSVPPPALPATDVSGVAWTSKVINLPTPFGNAPCGQIEFSPNSPFTVTVFVQDTAVTFTHFFQYTKTAILVRPNGNIQNSCGNFGNAKVSMKVDCLNKNILCVDSTNLAYNNILAPLSSTNKWILVYPKDDNGNDIPVTEALNVPNVNFPTSINSEGYVLYFQEYATYDYGNGITVIIQYKLFDKQGGAGLSFAINCNTNLCLLQCQMHKLYELSKGNCGVLVNSELMNRITVLNLLYSEILTGIFQPLCGINVPWLIAEWQRIGKFDANCDCDCNDLSLGFSNPSGGGSCCPIYTKVIDISTSLAPAEPPYLYFPCQVYDPTGTIITGIAYDITQLITVLNNYAAWKKFGTAFVVDNYTIGWYAPASPTAIPNTLVDTNTEINTGCTNGRQLYPVTVYDICYSPTNPINPASYPLNVYVNYGLGAGLVFAGNVGDQFTMIAALNAMASKPTSVKFIAGPTPDQVFVSNSNCTAFSNPITITSDAESNSFILYGANHYNITGDFPSHDSKKEFAFSTASLSNLGRLPGFIANVLNFGWHNIKIGNVLIAADPTTGIVYFWDITNPLIPTLSRTIQLNKVVSNCFSGTPESVTLGTSASPATAIPSLYGLYFPTDYYEGMGLSEIYIVESLTGSIWKLNYFDTGLGIVGSFQTNKLIGKCPRILLNDILFFSQDGDLEQATSQTSGAPVGNMTYLATFLFSSSGVLNSVNIFPGGVEYVWAISYDGNESLYFTGNKGSISVGVIDASVATIPNSYSLYPTVAGAGVAITFRVNTVYLFGKLYVTPQHMNNGFNGMIIDTTTLAGPVSIAQFEVPPGSTMDGMFTFTPLGNCMGILTSAFIPGDAPQYMALYTLDGKYLSKIFLSANQEFFNVVVIPNVRRTTPNSFLGG